MSKRGNRYYLIILCIVLSLTATACFRDSAEGVGAQPVSELLTDSTVATVPVVPTATEEIVLEVEETEEVILEVEETEEVILEVEETEEVVLVLPAETATDEPVLEVPTETATDEPVLEVPTETATDEPVLVLPTETATIDPIFLMQSQTPTDAPVLVQPTQTPDLPATQQALLNMPNATITIDPLFLRLTPSATPEGGIVVVGNTVPGGTAIAQEVTEVPDTFSLTATALIGQLTQDAAAVATTQAFEAGIGTTPTLTPTATIDPLTQQQPTALPQGGVIVPGADCIHQIRRGETLFQLSLAYGVSVNEMASASGITNPSLILIGRRVTIPGCGTTGFRPPATSVPVPTATIDPNADIGVGGTDTTSAQAAVPGAGDSTVTTDGLAQAAQQDILNNAQADIQANAVAQGAAPVTSSRTYTVQQYDTLFEIAQNFGTTVDALAILNGITNINQITMGDVLQIP